MKIVGISACIAGIAHTYMAREKLIMEAEKKGYSCSIETQGTIGTEYKLKNDEIADADVVVLAVDVKVNGLDRFEGKPVVKVSTGFALKNADKVIQQCEEEIKKG